MSGGRIAADEARPGNAPGRSLRLGSRHRKTGRPRRANARRGEAIGFSPDGRQVVTFSMYSEVRVWEADTGKPARRLVVGHEVGDFVSQGGFVPGGLDTFHFNPSTNPKLAAAGRGRFAGGTRRPGNRKRRPCPGSTEFVGIAPARRTGSGLRFGWDRQLNLVADGTDVRTLPLPGTADNTLAFSADGTAVGCTTFAGTVELFGVDGKCRVSAKFREPVEEPDGTQTVFAIAADGKRAAVPRNQPKASRSSCTPAARRTRRIPVGNRSVLKLAFAPDGKRLAAGTEDGKVVVWDLAGGDPRVFAGHRGPVEAACSRPAVNASPVAAATAPD